MKVVAEKMRQMRSWLKSGGASDRSSAAFRGQNAAPRLDRAIRWVRNLAPAKRGSEPSSEDGESGGGGLRSALRRWQARHPDLDRYLRIAAVSLAVFLALPYLFILIYRFVDPPISAFMLRSAVVGGGVNQQWVDFDQISPHLARAAVISEDSRFCQHWGVDWHAVGEALEELEDGETPRGASTIPMQTAKNLFLWPEKLYIRKALEVPLAYFMSLVWPKQRIMEVYLNVAEWGRGIYGAEAAARHYFGRSAASLSRYQAALLVAALPNPDGRNAGNPGPLTRRIANRIRARVGREAQDASCIFDR